tara:strand:+ start:365 stop:847 length:483 start_codon:yes stop_codon:yes gene_type:complete
MKQSIDSLAVQVWVNIELEFDNLNKQQIESFFDKFRHDKRTLSFIEYYNRTVLDKEKIQFREFKYQWSLHFTTKFYTDFDLNYDKLIDEIWNKKNIKEFYDNYCIDNYGKRKTRQGSFCSKLFHTILPSEFPPIDTAIRNRFDLQGKEFITSVLIIKKRL